MRSRNSGSAFHVCCASNELHGAKLMYWLGRSRFRTSLNVPDPSMVLAQVTNDSHSATNASSSPGFTDQSPLVYVSVMAANLRQLSAAVHVIRRRRQKASAHAEPGRPQLARVDVERRKQLVQLLEVRPQVVDRARLSRNLG